jgi:hypothetical protein
MTERMTKAEKFGEPIAFDACDRIESHGVSQLEAGRKLVAVGLSRIRESLSGDELDEEMQALVHAIQEQSI